ncbi:unnamed protein product [Heligmosomoides polygyrus]|uniref:HTH_7 domain-containing protein n=1 Tax=Heligmosomoides polygyrus TaxID=6339 RepID=A0A183G9L4_HELPZ|nr:unnamed protein product [Heligmosomoides polygyrus]
MSRESERITVVELHKTGMRTADIVRTTGFKQRTVYKIVRRYKETGGTSDRPRSGRPTTATTPENINKVRCRIRRNPEVSMNKMATDLGISRERVQHIARRKLGLRSYKVARIHFLNDAMKAESYCEDDADSDAGTVSIHLLSFVILGFLGFGEVAFYPVL